MFELSPRTKKFYLICHNKETNVLLNGGTGCPRNWSANDKSYPLRATVLPCRFFRRWSFSCRVYTFFLNISILFAVSSVGVIYKIYEIFIGNNHLPPPYKGLASEVYAWLGDCCFSFRDTGVCLDVVRSCEFRTSLMVPWFLSRIYWPHSSCFHSTETGRSLFYIFILSQILRGDDKGRTQFYDSRFSACTLDPFYGGRRKVY